MSKKPVRKSEPEPIGLGVRLREQRKYLGLTLKEVADGAGLSVGFISQIERGLTTPSLTSLVAVSRVLQVHVSEFLAQPKVTAPLTRHSQRPHFAVGGNSLTCERLSSNFPGNVLRTLIIHQPPGQRSEPITHEGEEIFFMLDGALTVEVDGVKTTLEAGDSIHFPSTRVHSTWNHADRPATILHTCTMDVFGEEATTGEAETSMAVRRNSGRRRALKPRRLNKGTLDE